MSEERETRANYVSPRALTDDTVKNMRMQIFAYSGDELLPDWEDELFPGPCCLPQPRMLADDSSCVGRTRHVCTVTADLSAVRTFAPCRKNSIGVKYQRIGFDVALLFGGPEMKAQLVWKEDVSAL